MTTYDKPLPLPTADTRPFWDALKQHQLKIQRCTACGTLRHPPSPICPQCNSFEKEWVPVSGKGKVWSWLVVHRPPSAGWVKEVPYNTAIVELDEGVRLITNIVGCKNEDIHENMAVTAEFDDITPEFTLVKFRPLTSKLHGNEAKRARTPRK